MKKLKLKAWVEDLLYGTYFGLAVYLIFKFGLGIWKKYIKKEKLPPKIIIFLIIIYQKLEKKSN